MLGFRFGRRVKMNPIVFTETETPSPERCVIVINENLPAGKAANAAAVIALTVGQRHPILVGSPLIDADQKEYPGLIQMGIPVLAASTLELKTLAQVCQQQGLDRVIFPVEGQETTHYGEFIASVASQKTEELRLLGIAIIGGKKAVRKLTAAYKLFA